MAHSINGMAERFRARLDQRETIPLPGCYDVLSALISEDAGFEAVFLSGYGVAASFLGNPDIGLTTLSETAQLARNVVDAVNVPWSSTSTTDTETKRTSAEQSTR
jgi:2,3-dimethylmalate lyase